MKELDNYYMELALKEAHVALSIKEVPVGAVVVVDGKVIGKGYNQVEQLKDPTAHAEMIAITSACNTLGTRYLAGATLYVTLEPCQMCAGAIRWAQIDRLVFAALDLKHGFYSSEEKNLHQKMHIVSGVMQEECSQLLKTFFKSLR